MLSEVAIKEFKDIYRAEYGVDISDNEALEMGINLLTFYNKIYRPVKKEWFASK